LNKISAGAELLSRGNWSF